MKMAALKKLLEEGLPDATILLEGDNGYVNAVIISPSFIGQSKVKQQQKVYEVLNKVILDGTLHAFSMKTYTPEEWEQLQ